jgi:hypothetical protein
MTVPFSVVTDLGFSKKKFSEIKSLTESLWPQTKQSNGNILILIFQSFD